MSALRDLLVLDSPPEALFDRLAHMASQVCGTPIALVSLVDSERQWFKANVGLPGVNQTPRDVAFCAHAIHGDSLFEVPDATQDARFRDNPLVTGNPDIRFYAGQPLLAANGQRVGTLCVIDRQARQLSAAQAGLLKDLAQLTAQALAMRRDLIDKSLSVRTDYERRLAEREAFVRQITDQVPVRIAYVDRELRYQFVNEAHCQRFNLDRSNILGRTRTEITGRPPGAEEARALQAALDGRAQRYDLDEWLDGKRRRIENQLVPDVGPDGRVRGFFASGTDITERSAIERSLRELNAILESTTDLVLQTDRDGGITWMNPALQHFCGDAALPRHLAALYTPQGRQQHTDVIEPALALHGVWVGQSSLAAPDGRAVPVSHLVIAHRDDGGQVDRYSAVMRDISDLERTRLALELQAATLSSMIEAVPALVAVVGADERYRYINSAFERWLARPRDQILGRTVAEVLGPHEHERSQPWFQRVLAGETVSFDKHYPERPDTSHMFISLVPLRLNSGVVDGWVTVAQDITRHKREAVRLLELSQRDALTGLLNRAGFTDTLERWLGDDDHLDVALLYIDLDHFKPVNDEHGHGVGDEVLRQFGQRLRALVRPSDAVARLGGDEFALALEGVHDQQAVRRVADQVVQAAGLPFLCNGLTLQVGASVGVALGMSRDTGWGDLVARADALLYQAKAAGRGRHASAGH